MVGLQKITGLILLVALAPAIAAGQIGAMKLQAMGEMRYLGLIKVYDARLYAHQPVTARSILDDDTSRCLTLTYSVALSAEDFIRGANTILTRQHPPEKIALLENEINRLHGAYRNVDKGDAYSLCYEAAGRTTTLFLNQEELVRVVSAEFAQVYFGIWLGPKAPIDKALRDKLLDATEGGSNP